MPSELDAGQGKAKRAKVDAENANAAAVDPKARRMSDVGVATVTKFEKKLLKCIDSNGTLQRYENALERLLKLMHVAEEVEDKSLILAVLNATISSASPEAKSTITSFCTMGCPLQRDSCFARDTPCETVTSYIGLRFLAAWLRDACQVIGEDDSNARADGRSNNASKPSSRGARKVSDVQLDLICMIIQLLQDLPSLTWKAVKESKLWSRLRKLSKLNVREQLTTCVVALGESWQEMRAKANNSNGACLRACVI
jgi:hypothetical protein